MAYRSVHPFSQGLHAKQARHFLTVEVIFDGAGHAFAVTGSDFFIITVI